METRDTRGPDYKVTAEVRITHGLENDGIQSHSKSIFITNLNLRNLKKHDV